MGKLDNMRNELNDRKSKLAETIKQHYKDTSVIQSISVQDPVLAETILNTVANTGSTITNSMLNLFAGYGVDGAENRRAQIAILMDIAQKYGIEASDEEKLYEDVGKLIETNDKAREYLISILSSQNK